MAIGTIGGGTTGGQAGAGSGVKTAGGTDAADFAQILASFRKEAAKTPAERARDEVLKKHHLTEDGYKALPNDQKKAIDAEIAIAAQRAMHADRGKGFKGAENAAAVATAQDPTGYA